MSPRESGSAGGAAGILRCSRFAWRRRNGRSGSAQHQPESCTRQRRNRGARLDRSETTSSSSCLSALSSQVLSFSPEFGMRAWPCQGLTGFQETREIRCCTGSRIFSRPLRFPWLSNTAKSMIAGELGWKTRYVIAACMSAPLLIYLALTSGQQWVYLLVSVILLYASNHRLLALAVLATATVIPLRVSSSNCELPTAYL